MKKTTRKAKAAARPFLEFHAGPADAKGAPLTPYQKAVRRLLSGEVGKEIEREFGAMPEIIYALRVVSSYLSAQVRSEKGSETFNLHDWSVPWTVAINNRLDREGKTEATIKSPWLKDLEKAGLLRILGRAGGGYLKVSFEPCASVVMPLLERCAKEAPEHVARELAKQQERNDKIAKVIERQEREGLATPNADKNAADVNASMMSEAEHLQRMMKAMGLGNAKARSRALELDAEQAKLRVTSSAGAAVEEPRMSAETANHWGRQ